jgi:hypothetical protein
MKNKLMEKEQQQQHLINMMKDDENLGLYENWVEDAEKESSLSDLNSKANIFWSGFRVGVKSKERMYSEEEVKEALLQMRKTPMTFVPDKRIYSEEDMAESFMACWKANVSDGIECKLSFKEWFEQFKKK